MHRDLMLETPCYADGRMFTELRTHGRYDLQFADERRSDTLRRTMPELHRRELQPYHQTIRDLMDAGI